MLQKIRKIAYQTIKQFWPTRLTHPNTSKSYLSASSEGFNSKYSYFLLHASYGDKWCILSYLENFLEIHQNTVVISSKEDVELVRIFIKKELQQSRFIYVDKQVLNTLSDMISPNSLYSAQLIIDPYQLTQTQPIIEHGFPIDTIRHLHIVKYPYFSDLHITHGVSYGTLLKTILAMPADSTPRKNLYFTDMDINYSEYITNISFSEKHNGKILLNIVNFSHKGFCDDNIRSIIDTFISYRFIVLVNLTQHPDPNKIINLLKENGSVKFVVIPGHLLSLVSDRVSAVCGILGGAMNVAVQFSSVDCLGFVTDAVGYNYTMNNVYGGKYKDNLWRFYDQDWAFFSENRLLDNVYIGDPSSISQSDLSLVVENFCIKLMKKNTKEK